MALDEDLAERMRAILAGTGAVREVRMFGGLCFMLNGNMGCRNVEARPSCACWQRPALPRIGARGREADGDVGPADGGLCLHRSATA